MPADGRRRVVVERVTPEVDGGRCPIKRIVGESVRVGAWIHADGHDVLAAVVRHRPVADDGWAEMPLQALGNDEWTATFPIDRSCPYEYTVVGWIDAFATWRQGLAAKVAADQDVANELTEGAAMMGDAAGRARAAGAEADADWLIEHASRLDGSLATHERVAAALDERVADVVRRYPDRQHEAAYDRVLTVSVDRERARTGAWYEMFPRSWGPDPSRSATLLEAEAHLPRIAAMAFDVVYLPPIHPVGTSFRKGRGNALSAQPDDPGSPWAIGSEAGGHKAVHPDLGTLADFDHFVSEARRLGLEVALDLAFQCSPDHPYVREHPEWFRHRPDGTIQYAENPPKKYQDLYPFDFACETWPALWAELKSVVEFWIAHGVSIFRVDNPHTKPYRFWQWLIREIRTVYPDAIFLAEAFTRPKVMQYLAKLGFTQSYTYFTWRNTKDEITDYFTELTQTGVAEYFRPNLFANTPDILHAFLQQGGRAPFEIRLVLAAMLGASYGIYSGFELCESRAIPGTEEYLDSEKYQYREWPWEQPEHIRELIGAVNRIRREHPALQADRSLVFCETDNPYLIAFSKQSPSGADRILVVVNLDSQHMQHGFVQVPLDPVELADGGAYEVTDLLGGSRYTWQGPRNYVRLDPGARVAHIFALPSGPPELVVRTDERLATFLPRQRWFAGKARQLAAARLVDWSAPGAMPDGVTLAIAEVQYGDGPGEWYFLPLSVAGPEATGADGDDRIVARTARGVIRDALADDRACRHLVHAMFDGRQIPMRDGSIRADTFDAAEDIDLLPIVRSTAEQSNSCVILGRRYVLKLLRRLDPGPNPEVEISRFLTRRGFRHAPRLAASLEYARAGVEPATVALVQGFVANDGTGWERAVEDVRQFFQAAADPIAAPEIGFATAAATLGRTTADLHLALAGDDSDPAFASEPFTAAQVASFAAALHDDAERTLALLADRRESLKDHARELADVLFADRATLARRVDALAQAPAGSRRTRVHGDYHLGQVLSAGPAFVIIDFEGEPARPLVERRAKCSPLKDVAGMLRSFSYAAHAVRLTETEERPELAPRLADAARRWAEAVSTAFLKQYRQTIAPGSLVPVGDVPFGRLLDAFILEKALYEIRYELASRPEWAAIPLAAILHLLNGSSPTGAGQ